MSADCRGGRLSRARWLKRSFRTQVILASIAAFLLAMVGWYHFATRLVGPD
ncbi:MAG: hypothetical protein ACE5IL_15065 [Myxococcota bacterium]